VRAIQSSIVLLIRAQGGVSQGLCNLNSLLYGQECAGSRISMKQQFDVIVYATYQYVAESPAKLIRAHGTHHMSVLLAVHRAPPEIGVRYPDGGSRRSSSAGA
jgi:hypothetical protein